MIIQNAQINMVKQQLRTGEVLDETILSLFETMPRHEFLPPNLQSFAYCDLQIELPHKQRMMTPLEEGKLLQALALKKTETVLEVGTGTGFLTALLSKLCKQVISIDYFPDFTEAAKKKLANHHCTNVELLTGDASRGWLEKAPYEVIVFTGSLEELEETQRLQLLPGGRLFAVIGKEPVMQGQVHHLDHNGNWHSQLIFETNIPPLINPLKPKDFVF